jgi:uncharacterized membrane protein YczE
MTGILIKVIIGLFIWLALPQLIIKKKKNPYKKFINVSCVLIGIVLIIYGIFDILKTLIDFE